MNDDLEFSKILDYNATIAKEELVKLGDPWKILSYLAEYIRQIGKHLEAHGYTEILPEVWVGKSVSIAKSAEINSPCIIGDGSEIRHCAYIRGSVLIGNECVIGNSTELKNCIIFDGTHLPHYNYVGDSVLGRGVHLGASSVISNLKSDGKNVCINIGDRRIETERRKFGAIVGDCAEIGCGSVLNPGSIIGKGSRIYPHSTIRGFVPANSIYKSDGRIVDIQ